MPQGKRWHTMVRLPSSLVMPMYLAKKSSSYQRTICITVKRRNSPNRWKWKHTSTYYYDAFGNIVDTTGDIDNPYRYSGYQYDEETNLYYLNSRMYDPTMARFMQEDTYTGDINDPLTLNQYTYLS